MIFLYSHSSPPVLPRLTNLDLFNIKFETFAEALNFICNFPALNDLSLDVVRWPHRQKNIPQGCPRLPHSLLPTLHSLTVKRCPKVDLLHWLLHQNETHYQIHTLRIDSVHVERHERGAIDNFIESLGPSLEHLHCGYASGTFLTVLFPPYSF
jgi:hypothetical protein